MKKLVLMLSLCFLLGKSFSQGIMLPNPPTSYGTNMLRLSVWTAMFLPTGCGKPGFMALYANDSTRAAFKYDSCNHKWWTWDPSRKAWQSNTDSVTNSKNSDSLIHIAGANFIQYGGTGITTGSSSYSVPAGTVIDKISFYDPALTYISIGTSVNGWQICPRFTISAGLYSVIGLDKYFATTTTIYFNGVTSNTIIKIYKL